MEDKQTYIQLASKHACSSRTVQMHLDKVEPREIPSMPKDVIVLMGITYFGRKFGVMLFKDAFSGVNLYKTNVKTETNQQYAQVLNTCCKKALQSVS